jgi:aminoglycoside phosphotransferase (APT) family kinase protein
VVATHFGKLRRLDSVQISLALETLAAKLATRKVLTKSVRMSGGASQETWKFDLATQDLATQDLARQDLARQDLAAEESAVTSFILRRSPWTGPRNGEAIGLANEARLIAAAGRAGVPVPDIVHVCEPDDGLGEAVIMSFVEGETLARKILRDPQFEHARGLLAHQCGNALAKIHAVALSDLPQDLPISDGPDQLSRYEEIFRGFGVHRPVIELAFRWLRDTPPPPLPPTLVHGDFRLGNLIVGTDGLRAVLDWELAHVGDPREDLAWICVNSWRFGQSHNQVGGFGSLRQLLDGYEGAGGVRFEAADIRWFQTLGSLKWAIMCLIMYQAFKTGADTTIERAMIGRRTSEAEIDLLNLMEGRARA